MDEQKMQVGKAGVATSVIPGDVISINLAATRSDGSRLHAGGIFNHLGEAVNAEGQVLPGKSGLDITLLSGSVKPEFPMSKYQELMNQGSTEAAEDVQTQYDIDIANWEAEGNQSIEDSIAAAALDWAKRTEGVETEDVGDKPYVKPENIVVKTVVRKQDNDPGIWIVQITPNWG